jgi:hypothetical protein
MHPTVRLCGSTTSKEMSPQSLCRLREKDHLRLDDWLAPIAASAHPNMCVPPGKVDIFMIHILVIVFQRLLEQFVGIPNHRDYGWSQDQRCQRECT